MKSLAFDRERMALRCCALLLKRRPPSAAVSAQSVGQLPAMRHQLPDAAGRLRGQALEPVTQVPIRFAPIAQAHAWLEWRATIGSLVLLA